MDKCIPSRLHFYPEEYDFPSLLKDDHKGDIIVALLGQLKVERDELGQIKGRKLFPESVVFNALEHASPELFIRLARLFEPDFVRVFSGLTYTDEQVHFIGEVVPKPTIRRLAAFLITQLGMRPPPKLYAQILFNLYDPQNDRPFYDFIRDTHNLLGYRLDEKAERFQLTYLMAFMIERSTIRAKLLPFLKSLGYPESIEFLQIDPIKSKYELERTAVTPFDQMLNNIPKGRHTIIDLLK